MPPHNPAQPANETLELIRLIGELSYHRSEVPFKLSSGRMSHHFIDLKPAALHPLGSKLIANMMLHHLRDLSPELIGGVESGGIPLVAAICALSPIHLFRGAFFVRKQAKGHGTDKLLDGMFFGGAKVVLVEDVTTTGGSVLRAAEAIRGAGGNLTHVLTVIDREEGATEALRANDLTLVPLLKLSDLKILDK
jgi:orotate phosphoribosyltransferase